MFYCKNCGEMKIIAYKYISSDLQIISECIKENVKSSYSIELFLNLKLNQKINYQLKCNLHNSSFTYWCNDCKVNICDKCFQVHNNHITIKLSTLLINNKDITNLIKKVENFKSKLNSNKKKVDEKKLFNQKEEIEFLRNFLKYYKFNCLQIDFIQKMKDLYLYLIKNNLICYQILRNIKYIVDKLNKEPNTTIGQNKNMNNNKETNDILDIYYMVFNSENYCLLPNNEKEEMEKEAEEKQKELIVERSIAMSPDELSQIFDENTFNLNDIPLTESIKISEDIARAKSVNAINNMFSNPFINNNEDNNNKNNNNEINNNINELKSSLIDSDSDVDSNFCLLKSQILPLNNQININNQNNQNPQQEKPRFYGLFLNGKYHGDKCVLYYPNGFVYEGSFREGLRHGIGTLKHEPSKYCYQGGWAYDKKNGKCIETINGEKFEGFYKNGIREGKCTITYSNKDIFEGNLVDGKKDGFGKQFYFKTNTKYIGEFKNNVYEGKGEITSDNGYYFKGEFLGGLRHGDNCIEEKKGFKKYKGQFKRDKMNGKGEFEWYSGESKGDIYNGEFKDDLFDGFGTYQSNDGSIYIGEYVHGRKHGKGKEIYSDGSVYEGEYNEGQKSGKGIFQDFEGNVYEGNFYNGNKHSKGKITYMNGEILEGLWLNGLKEGNFYYTDSNGNKYFRKYAKDELIEEKKEGFFSSFFTSVFDKITSLIK